MRIGPRQCSNITTIISGQKILWAALRNIYYAVHKIQTLIRSREKVFLQVSLILFLAKSEELPQRSGTIPVLHAVLRSVH